VKSARGITTSPSDFAEGDLARSVREIHAFPFLPERDRDRILGDNAVRFLGLDE
jgi:predicted TIM-barrel fold metal-dependent hydrolase